MREMSGTIVCPVLFKQIAKGDTQAQRSGLGRGEQKARECA